MNLVLAAALLTGTATIVLVVALVRAGGSGVAGARLRKLSPDRDSSPDVPSVTGMPREDSMPTVTGLLSGHGMTERLYTELSAAGLPIRPSEFLGIVIACVIVSQVVAVFVVGSVLAHVLFGLVAASIPVVVLKVLQARRRAAFEAQIVDCLVMTASSLRSGFSFLRAMQLVARETTPPISTEFQRAINEMNVGRPLEDALRGIVARVKSYDFDLVVTAVLIQHQVGGNLAEILETIAATIRERMRIVGEISALTAEGRLSGAILVLLPITLGFVLTAIRPVYMSTLVKEPIGHYIIAVGLLAQVIGAVIIKKMLVVDI